MSVVGEGGAVVPRSSVAEVVVMGVDVGGGSHCPLARPGPRRRGALWLRWLCWRRWHRESPLGRECTEAFRPRRRRLCGRRRQKRSVFFS
jgi:hypothetical protein